MACCNALLVIICLAKGRNSAFQLIFSQLGIGFGTFT